MAALSSTSKQRPGAANYTQSERDVFVGLLDSYKDIIEKKKKTDSQTRTEKANGWKNLTIEFNSLSSVHYRTEDNLKSLWDNLKRSARKAQSHERKETFKTGGGPRDTSGDPSSLDHSVLAVLGPSGVGLYNPYDGDATENGASFNIIKEFETNPFPDENPISVLIREVPRISTSPPAIVVPAEVPTPTQEHQGGSSSTETEGLRWDDTIPSHLSTRKSSPLRVRVRLSSGSSSTASVTSSGSKQKSTGNSPWSKRRRPSLLEVDTKQLVAAKLELINLTKAELIESQKRQEVLFGLDKEKKSLEVELLRLQVLKMRKDTNVE